MEQTTEYSNYIEREHIYLFLSDMKEKLKFYNICYHGENCKYFVQNYYKITKYLDFENLTITHGHDDIQGHGASITITKKRDNKLLKVHDDLENVINNDCSLTYHNHDYEFFKNNLDKMRYLSDIHLEFNRDCAIGNSVTITKRK